MAAEVMLMTKAGEVISPLLVRNPETAIAAARRICEELESMNVRCQSILLTATKSLPDEGELDAMETRLAELRAELDDLSPAEQN